LMDLSAELIALIYIYRWQIEIFFRWFKCVLSAEHLLCHSQNGITIQKGQAWTLTAKVYGRR
ncbi:MAG: transposase, partial [Candidatus Anammoxibacter sp.]